MKPITALLLLSLASVGAACSATSSSTAEAAPASEDVIQVAEAGGVQGTLNLKVGPAGDAPARPIVGVESAKSSGGPIVAPGSAGGNFEGVADLGIDIETAPETVLAPEPASSEDDIVRLPSQD